MSELKMVSDNESDGPGIDIPHGVPAVRLHAGTGERSMVHFEAGLDDLNHMNFDFDDAALVNPGKC